MPFFAVFELYFGLFFRPSKIKCTDEVIYNRDFPCLGFFIGMGNFDTIYKLAAYIKYR